MFNADSFSIYLIYLISVMVWVSKNIKVSRQREEAVVLRQELYTMVLGQLYY